MTRRKFQIDDIVKWLNFGYSNKLCKVTKLYPNGKYEIITSAYLTYACVKANELVLVKRNIK